jgi:hypothetical protein
VTQATNMPPERATAPSNRSTEDLAKSAGAAARSTASDVAGSISATAKAKGAEMRQGVADEVADVATALRKAADEMRNGSAQQRTMGQIANGLADASEAVGNKDLGELAGELSAFARRNPLVFLGGAALVGFAAARFAKASSTTPVRRSGHDSVVRPAAVDTPAGTAPMGPAGMGSYNV